MRGPWAATTTSLRTTAARHNAERTAEASALVAFTAFTSRTAHAPWRILADVRLHPLHASQTMPVVHIECRVAAQRAESVTL